MDYEIINVGIFDPRKALFKESKKEAAKCYVYKCSSKDTCQLYEQSQCIQLKTFGGRCPYGTTVYESGYTTKANKYSKWLREKEYKYQEYKSKLSSPNEMLAEVGEYIYLPYPHMNFDSKVEFLTQGSLLNSGMSFLSKEDFNVENVKKLINHRPKALFGGEITDYQKKVVPKFIQHIKEKYPELYKELSQTVDFSGYEEHISNVGRKAILNTVKGGSVFKSRNGTWEWDGKYLTSEDANVFPSPVKSSKTTVSIEPDQNTEIEITSEDQVTKNTIFTN